MVSARRTYIDLFLKASSDSSVKGSSLYFYDLNAKANYHFDSNNAVFLSGYFGKDVIGLKNTFGTNWGNTTGTIRFNHIFSSKLFSNTSLIYSNYNYVIQSYQTDQSFKATSKITDLNFKEDFQYSASDSHHIKFGVNVLHHSIEPGDISSPSDNVNAQSVQQRYGLESAAYVSDDWKISDRLNILYGVRLSDFTLLGPGTFNTFDAAGNVIAAQNI
jgi:outer membrane receptor for ferrienterochelin and colicin